jgi:dihydroflavonol-4-reductase
MSILDIANALRSLGDAARKVPAREIPDWLVRIAALRDPAIKQTLPELGKRKYMTGDKAERVLQWSPRPPADAIVATGKSLAAEARVDGKSY